MRWLPAVLASLFLTSACSDATTVLRRRAIDEAADTTQKTEMPSRETDTRQTDESTAPPPAETLPEQTLPPPAPSPNGTTAGLRYEPDVDFHNMFDGVFWRIQDGYLEVRDAARPTGSLTLVDQCLKTFGASFDKWSATLQIKVAQLYATAVTESGCVNEPGSFDGLSSGLMQVTGTTCAEVMKKAGRALTADACKKAMYATPDFSIEVGTRYMSDPYQISLNKFTPINGTTSKRGPALDPPKVAAAYNAGTLKATTANRWHLVVTADHLERYTNAYNAFVEYTKKQGFVPQPTRPLDFTVNAALPREVPTVEDLEMYGNAAREGNAIFVGDRAARRGDFYYWVDGRWRAASERW